MTRSNQNASLCAVVLTCKHRISAFSKIVWIFGQYQWNTDTVYSLKHFYQTRFDQNASLCSVVLTCKHRICAFSKDIANVRNLDGNRPFKMLFSSLVSQTQRIGHSMHHGRNFANFPKIMSHFLHSQSAIIWFQYIKLDQKRHILVPSKIFCLFIESFFTYLR